MQENNLGVIAASSRAMSILTNDGPQPGHPACDETKEQGRKAAEFCKHRGVDLSKLAMYHASQLKGPSTFLASMKTREQLRTNLEAIHDELSEKEHSTLRIIQDG